VLHALLDGVARVVVNFGRARPTAQPVKTDNVRWLERPVSGPGRRAGMLVGVLVSQCSLCVPVSEKERPDVDFCGGVHEKRAICWSSLPLMVRKQDSGKTNLVRVSRPSSFLATPRSFVLVQDVRIEPLLGRTH
jgi:hypothetical protein